MGNITNGNYLQLSNTIDNIESLKTNINKYDIISISNTFCNDKIINYINSNL